MRAQFVMLLIAVIYVLAGCVTQGTRATSSVYAYLYPDEDNVIVEPQRAVIKIPVNVGIAFVPQDSARGASGSWLGYRDPVELDSVKKRELLEKVAARFEQYEFIGHIEIIPTSYLRSGGSFENLGQVARMHNVDIMALVSYDQVQTTDEGASTISYWTLIGTYFVEGEKNTTTTLLDTAVFDVASRRMLFRAPGTSKVKGDATLIDLAVELRKDSYAGFEQAADDMIKALDAELARFRESVKERPEDFKIIERKGYTSHGGGAVGWPFVLSCLGLLIKHRLA